MPEESPEQLVAAEELPHAVDCAIEDCGVARQSLTGAAQVAKRAGAVAVSARLLAFAHNVETIERTLIELRKGSSLRTVRP